MKNSNDTIGNRTRDLPACIVGICTYDYIYTAISGDRKDMKKEAEKILKYKELTI